MGSCCSVSTTIEVKNNTVILKSANGFTSYIPIKDIVSLNTYDGVRCCGHIRGCEIVTVRDNHLFFSNNKSNYERNVASLLAAIESTATTV